MSPKWLSLIFAIFIALFISGCELQRDEPSQSDVTLLFSLDENATFFERPFPMDFERDPDGTVSLLKFPNPERKLIIQRYIDAAEILSDFGLNSGIFFPATDLIDEHSLPTLSESVQDDATAFIVNIDKTSRRYKEKVPALFYVRERTGDFTKRGLITFLPMPGYPLAPDSLYAAVVTDRIRDKKGLTPKADSDFVGLRDGRYKDSPTWAGAKEVFQPLWDYLDEIGFDKKNILCATVFRTQNPWREMLALRDYVYSNPARYVDNSLHLVEEYYDYCFVEGRFEVPIFQRGKAPYLTEGGYIEFDEFGMPIVDHYENLRFSLCIPKAKMPKDGFPLLIHAHGSGGSYRTIVDRGARGMPAGSGLAWYMSKIGVATASMDAPHHGERDPFFIHDPSLESLFFFNALNPFAFRDNIRQAAIEQMMLEIMLLDLRIDPKICSGVDASASPDKKIGFDPDNIFFHGHSQGAVVAGPFLGTDTISRAALLTGAGAHMILTMLTKKSPADTYRLLLWVAGLPPTSDELNEFSPLLSLAQMLSESADPINFAQTYFFNPAPAIFPKHILQIVGIDDTYVSKETQYAAALAARMNPVGNILDDLWLDRFELLSLDVQSYPVAFNQVAWDESPITAAFVEYVSDGSFDGHFVFYEFNEPKYQALCFFKTLIDSGIPTIFAPKPDPFAPCLP